MPSLTNYKESFTSQKVVYLLWLNFFYLSWWSKLGLGKAAVGVNWHTLPIGRNLIVNKTLAQKDEKAFQKEYMRPSDSYKMVPKWFFQWKPIQLIGFDVMRLWWASFQNQTRIRWLPGFYYPHSIQVCPALLIEGQHSPSKIGHFIPQSKPAFQLPAPILLGCWNPCGGRNRLNYFPRASLFPESLH